MLLKNSEWLPRLVAAESQSFAEQPSLITRLFDRVAVLLADAAEALAERRQRRQTFRKLAELDDHMLQDLGLTRSDLPGWTRRSIGGWSSFYPRRRMADRRQ